MAAPRRAVQRIRPGAAAAIRPGRWRPPPAWPSCRRCRARWRARGPGPSLRRPRRPRAATALFPVVVAQPRWPSAPAAQRRDHRRVECRARHQVHGGAELAGVRLAQQPPIGDGHRRRLARWQGRRRRRRRSGVRTAGRACRNPGAHRRRCRCSRRSSRTPPPPPASPTAGRSRRSLCRGRTCGRENAPSPSAATGRAGCRAPVRRRVASPRARPPASARRPRGRRGRPRP